MIGRITHLARIDGVLALSQPVGDHFRYHLVEQLVGPLHLLVELPHGLFKLLALLLLLVQGQFQLHRLLRAC